MSAWTLTATKANSGAGFEKAPPGNHPAVLVGIIDMGTQTSEYAGESKAQHRVYFVWELVTKKQSASNRNHVIGLDVTLSLNEKAKLRGWIEARIGRPIREGEDYDVSKELGQPCLLNVVEKGGYPKVNGVAGVPEGMTVPPGQLKPVATRVYEYLETGTVRLPDWVPWFYGEPVSERIKDCEELKGKDIRTEMYSQTGGATTAAAGAPRRRVPAAERKFYFAASDAADPTLMTVSQIKDAVEAAKMDVSLAEVCPEGGTDDNWTPLCAAIPEAATWGAF